MVKDGPMIARPRSLLLAGMILLASPCSLQASKILLLTGNDSTNTAALDSVLTSAGNSVTVGPSYNSFTGQGLSGYNVVMLVPNGSSNQGDMPTSGQQAIVNFVQGGGGLVTGEPVLISTYAYPPVFPGYFATLAQTFPAMYASANTFNSPLVFSTLTKDPVMNAGLPSTFSVNAQGWDTETYIVPKLAKAAVTGVTSFLSTNQWTSTPGSFFGWNGAGSGLVGGSFGAGRVVNMSTGSDNTELSNPNYVQLLANAVNWAGQTTGGTPPQPVGPPIHVPEPTSLAIYGAGTLGFLVRAWSRRARSAGRA
jgi:Trehalose utilisation